MKITLDCERMKYPHTGLFEYCQQLGQSLKSAKDIGDEISFYLESAAQQYFEPTDRFLIQKGLQKFIFPRFKNIDVWHTTYQLSSYIPKRKSIKRVLTIHDLNFIHEGKTTAKIRGYLKKLQRNIDLADHIVAISNFTKNDIIEHLSVADKPITVIYNGCAELNYDPDFNITQQPSSPFLFALGTVNPKKNFHVLIPLLTTNNFELIIAGKTEPDYKNRIMEEAQKYQVADRVKVIGPVSDQEKIWYYNHCEAFLFPSLAEGFGIPPIEAMRFGKPTFLSNKTSLPEIGGTLAYYFDDFEPAKMQQVFLDGMEDYKQHHPAQKIKQHASQFNWKNAAKQYLEVYRSILNA